jgi:adenosylhomocysteine nucleosidase
MKILILTALPQEHSPLKKLLPGRYRVKGKALKEFAFKVPDKEIVLIESGMGAKWAEEATRAEILEFMPDLLIFSGFAGALHPDLKIGSVCFTVRVREESREDWFNFRFPGELDDFLTRNHILRVLAISSEFPDHKKAISTLASGQMAVLDMETARVAEIALESKVPFVCFRAISDCLDHELGFSLSDICDERGRVSLWGVFLTVLRRPSVLKAFYLSWRRSRVAANNLCRTVAAFVGNPADALIKMAREIRIER